MSDLLPGTAAATATVPATAPPELAPPHRRLVSLDVFRGLTILAMLMVENQGNGRHAFPGTSHAAWNGLTPADVVFPAFLFIVGVSIAYACSPAPRARPPGTHRRAFARTARLFLLGLVLTGLGRVPLETLHVMGVLQRIALCYLLATLLVVHVPVRHQVALAGAILAGYTALLLALPVPGHGDGVLTPEGNAAGFVDRALLGARHLYRDGPYDPEGLTSTLPALVTVLAGVWAGMWIRRRPPGELVARTLWRAGIAAALLGAALAPVLPVNKRLWTPSFVLVTAGMVLVVFAWTYRAVELQGRVRAAFPLVVFGRNAVFVYVASQLAGGWLSDAGVRDWVYRNGFVPWAGLHGGSLAYSLAVTAGWWALLLAMYRRRWFLRI